MQKLIAGARSVVVRTPARMRSSVSPRTPARRHALDLAQLEDRIMPSASPMGDLTMPAAAVPVVDDLVSIVIPATVADPLAMTPAGANSRVDRTIDAYAGQIAGWSISDEHHEDDRTVEKMFEEQGRAEKEMSYAE